MPDVLTFPRAANARSPEAIAAYNRRLSDKIMLAFHQACEQQDTPVAKALLAILDFMWERDQDAPWGRRRNVNYLVPARERYQHLLFVTRTPIGPDAD